MSFERGIESERFRDIWERELKMSCHTFFNKYSFKNVDGSLSGLIELDDQQLKDLHQVLLPMLVDILDYCKRNDLLCFLSGGTALGALRHHGFIPWDDDADLNMTRDSFAKFASGFREQYADKYWVHTPADNPEFGLPIGRVRKKGTIVKTKEDLIDDTEAGAYIDIFVVENVFDNKLLRTIQGCLCILTKVCLSCRRFYRDREIMRKALGYNAELQKVSNVRMIIGFLTSFMSVSSWNRINEKASSMCKNPRSKFVSIPAGRWHFFGEMYPRERFCSLSSMKFEGIDMPVCVGMDEYMRILFGDDYMEIPEESKREKHLCWKFDLGVDK